MKKFTFITAIALLTLVSCVQPTNKRADYNSSTGSGWGGSGGSDNGWNNGGTDWGDDSGSGDNGNNEDTTPGDGYGDGNEGGVADGGQTQDFYTIEGITLHGNSRVNGSNAWWSSTSLGDGQLILYTDSRLNIRVRPRQAPAQGTMDSYGVKCHYNPQPYEKLKIKLCIRSESGTCSYRTVTFGDIATDKVSKVKEFSGSYIPNTAGPVVIDVLDVQWDWSCQYYLNQGYSSDDPAIAGYCQMSSVWQNDCVSFDLQFSTDYTKDFPPSAPRM